MQKIGTLLLILACFGSGCATTIKDVKSWEKEKDITQLMLAIDDKNTDVSNSAIQSLANIGAPIVKPIIKALKIEQDCKRGNKSKALEKLKDPLAVNPLVFALRRENACIRATIALGLVNIGKPSVKPLIDVLKDESLDVRKTAANVLYKLDWEPKTDLDRAYYAIATERWDDAYRLNAVAVEAFVDALRYERINRDVSSVLTTMGTKAVNPLVTQLKNAQIRRTAAWILSKIGEPAVEALIPVLQDGHVRDVVSWILAEIGQPAVKPLIESLNNRNIREPVVEALAKLGSPAVKPLVHVLKSKDPGMRRAAAKALGKIGDKRAIEALSVVARDKDLRVRRTAIKALEKIKW